MSISIIQSDIKRISARSKVFLAVSLPFFVVALFLGSIGYRRYALWLASSNFSIDTESLLFFAFIALFLMSIGILFSATPDGIGYVPLSLAVIGVITSILAIPFSDMKFYLTRYFSDNRPGIIGSGSTTEDGNFQVVAMEKKA